MSFPFKKYLIHLIAYLILLIVSFVYFSPAAFGDKVLPQSDNIMARGMQAEMRDYQDPDSGEYPLWTNSMFSGMPGYQILYHTDNPLKVPFDGFLLGNPMWPPHTAILLLMVGMYFLLSVLKVDWRIALFGAIAYGFGANFMDLLVAGHSTKVIALGYLPPIIGAVILTYRGNYLLGGALTAFFVGLQLLANHLQITYYTGIFVGILGLVFLIRGLRQKTLPRAGIATGIVALAFILGTASNIGRLWTTYEYSQESIRGTSELTIKDDNSYGSKAGEGGLSKDYVFGWSFGLLESYTLLIPNFMGGTSSENFVSDPESASYQALSRLQSQEEANQVVPLLSHYWGDQPGVGSPVYFGAVILFLFFLGIFLLRGPLRNWTIIGSALALLMAFGDNLAFFNYFLYDYLPLYNKFRAVTMILGPMFALVLILAFLGFQGFTSRKYSTGEKETALKRAGYLTGGLIVLGLLLSFILDYNTGNVPAAVAGALQEDRAALLRADALRSLIFVALAFGLLWSYLQRGFNAALPALGIGLLIVIDIFGVALRTLDKEEFTEPASAGNIIQPTEVDQQIMSDLDPHFRVADFRRSPFVNAITSYHHKSVGGYHAAKLMRYQELIEAYLGNPGRYQHVYSMLNTKYFIGQQGQPQRNSTALGNAWFVEQVRTVADGDAEFLALADFDPSSTAILQETYVNELGDINIRPDSNATITLTSYHPDTLIYRYSAASPQIAVFSEIYYPPAKGWKVYLDGEPYQDFVKANFLLRALPVPAGQNREIKMIFAPRAYYRGEAISAASGWLIGLLVLGSLVLFFVRRQGDIPDPDQLAIRDAGSGTSGTAKKGKRTGKGRGGKRKKK